MTRKQVLWSAIALIAAGAIVSFVIVRSVVRKPAVQAAVTAEPPTVVVTQVISKDLSQAVRLPGELQAYQDVAIYPKLQSFVEEIKVDRGSTVKRGQLLARLSAPELKAQLSEASAKVRAVQSQKSEAEARIQSNQAQRLEAEAKLASDEGTYRHLKSAAATPGVVAGNDVDVAEKTVDADRARVRLWEENEKAARAQLASIGENEKAAAEAAHSIEEMESYLQITAPFDGVITERNVHKGSLVGSAGVASSAPMLRIRQIAELRLIVSVPESEAAGVAEGSEVSFTVPAFPGETFKGVVGRIAHALDVKSRTMPVELDVTNTAGRLAPGMYAEVAWTARRLQPSLFVPPSAVATTTERVFVLRIKNDLVEWVDVKRGVTMGNKIEVFGSLEAGDQIVLRGSDELRDGTHVTVKQAAD